MKIFKRIYFLISYDVVIEKNYNAPKIFELKKYFSSYRQRQNVPYASFFHDATNKML